MEQIRGDELVSLLEASTNKKIGILDNNSISFFYKIKHLGKVEEIIKKYDIILIPQWVYYEVSDSESRVSYLESIENESIKIYIVDELEYEQISKYKSIWLYKFLLYSCFKNGKLKSFLKRYVEKNCNLEDLEDYEVWINDFYERAFEGEVLSNGRVQKKNAGEISICVLALVIAYNYSSNKHSITIISSDRDTYDYLQRAKVEISEDNNLKSQDNTPITFKSNDFVIRELYMNEYLMEGTDIAEIVEVRDERRMKYTVNSSDGSVEEHEKVVRDREFKQLLDDSTLNIIF